MTARAGKGRRRQPLGMALAAVCLALGLLSPPASSESILTEWGLKPKYDSSYKVNRTKTIWNQFLMLDRKSGLMRFKTKLGSDNQKDEARNDLDEAKNKAMLRVSRRMGFGDVFGVGELKWHRKENQRSLRVVHNNDFDLGSGVKLLQRSRGSLDLTLSGGITHKKDINEQTSIKSTRVDSTEAIGWSGGARLGGAWDPSKDFSFSGAGNYNTSTKDSRNTHTEADADTTIFEIQKATDLGRSLDVSSEGLWTRFEAFKLFLKGSYSDRSSQYFYAPKSAQETMSSQTILAATTIEGDPTERLHYGIDLRTKESSDNYDLQDRDGLSSSTNLSGSIRYELGLPLIAGAVARANFGVSDERRESQNQMSYESKRKDFRAELSRSFGKRSSSTTPSGIAARLALMGHVKSMLTQNFYDDGSLDADRLRSEATAEARYTPSDDFQSKVSYSWTEEQSIKIPRASSAQTQTRKDYRIAADYKAALPYGVSVRQVFQLSANYVYYVFDEDQNTLSRSNRVTTGITAPLWYRSRIVMDYTFQRNDSGSFVYSESQVKRVYIESQDRLRQNLKVMVKCDVTKVVSVKVIEVLDINSRTNIATGMTSRREKHTFTGEVGLRKRFESGMELDAKFARTISDAEDDYWDIRANIAMTFD